MKAVLAAMLMTLTTGCVVHQNGVARHVVIGFGIVSVPQTNSVAQITRVKAVGVYAGPGSFNVGAVSQLTANIETNANVIIEVK